MVRRGSCASLNLSEVLPIQKSEHSNLVKLVNAGSLLGENYTALSQCWGGLKMNETMTKNLDPKDSILSFLKDDGLLA